MPRCLNNSWRLYACGCTVALWVAAAAVIAQPTIIPLPEVIVDPNEGTTVGVLPVILFANEAKSVRRIVAPDVRYNDTFGVYPTIRWFEYPDPKRKYFLAAGMGTVRGEQLEAEFNGQDLLGGWLDLWTNGRHEQDPFERFFGFGNHSPDSDEANYTSNTQAVTVSAAINLPLSLQGTLQTRVRHVRIGQGGVTHLPQVRDPSSGFSEIKGVEGATIVGERFGFVYDTRDALDVPTRGFCLNTGIELIDEALGSSISFVKYNMEAKGFVPLRLDGKYVLALHSALDYLQHGENAPFYELNSVGGIHSLRAFGSHRFTDNHRFIMQAELRSNLYEREIFGVRAHLEVAPFLDAAKVFRSSRQFPVEDLHLVGGLGFRAVVVPQVVAYVDFGSSGDAPAVFTGIDYPF